MDQARKIAELEQKLAKQAEGSLFDIKRDKVEDIIPVIGNTVSPHKVMALGQGLVAWAKRKQQKPAG
jgi:hypothetical protein